MRVAATLTSLMGTEAKPTIRPHIWSRLIAPNIICQPVVYSVDILFDVQIALHILVVVVVLMLLIVYSAPCCRYVYIVLHIITYFICFVFV